MSVSVSCTSPQGTEQEESKTLWSEAVFRRTRDKGMCSGLRGVVVVVSDQDRLSAMSQCGAACWCGVRVEMERAPSGLRGGRGVRGGVVAIFQAGAMSRSISVTSCCVVLS